MSALQVAQNPNLVFATKADVKEIVDESISNFAILIKRSFDYVDEKSERRFQLVESRLDKVEVHLDRVEARLDKVEARLEAIEIRLDKIEARLEAIGERLVAIDARLEKLEIRFDALEAKFDFLTKTVINGFTEIHAILAKRLPEVQAA